MDSSQLGQEEALSLPQQNAILTNIVHRAFFAQPSHFHACNVFQSQNRHKAFYIPQEIS